MALRPGMGQVRNLRSQTTARSYLSLRPRRILGLPRPNPSGKQEIFEQSECYGVTTSCTQTTNLISTPDAGATAADGASIESSISDDGRFVAFASTATNLIPGVGPVQQIYLYDTCTGGRDDGRYHLRSEREAGVHARRQDGGERIGGISRASTGAAGGHMRNGAIRRVLRRKLQTSAAQRGERNRECFCSQHVRDLASTERQHGLHDCDGRREPSGRNDAACLRMATASCHRSAAMRTRWVSFPIQLISFRVTRIVSKIFSWALLRSDPPTIRRDHDAELLKCRSGLNLRIFSTDWVACPVHFGTVVPAIASSQSVDYLLL